ncbi:mfs monocarboxylate [Diplodia corticola]|uniref:Mfs monocarboxylate n=1 Tax=Diplodia corticola TaxID=236234 RepID=A0A1J9RLH6_9PEZI|nr:mfs monocarboxylate [Diplodia corticola]OJD29367.1 mfs monocarboxylate [Diplodia corticola]
MVGTEALVRHPLSWIPIRSCHPSALPAGSSVAGLAVSYVFTWLLSRYSFATATRVWALVAFAVPALLVLSAKPRLPVVAAYEPPTRRNNNNSRSIKTSFRFVPTNSFLSSQLGNVFHTLGHFIPSTYLPSYARSLCFSPAAAVTTSLALVNVGGFFGNIAAGALYSDALDISLVVLAVSLAAAAAASFLLWGLMSGSVAVSHSSAGVLETGPAFGLLGAGRGIGSIASGPLSEALLGTMLAKGSGGDGAFGYGFEYGSLIVFAGVAMLLGGAPGFAAKKLGWM